MNICLCSINTVLTVTFSRKNSRGKRDIHFFFFLSPSQTLSSSFCCRCFDSYLKSRFSHFIEEKSAALSLREYLDYSVFNPPPQKKGNPLKNLLVMKALALFRCNTRNIPKNTLTLCCPGG